MYCNAHAICSIANLMQPKQRERYLPKLKLITELIEHNLGIGVGKCYSHHGKEVSSNKHTSKSIIIINLNRLSFNIAVYSLYR